MIKELQKKLSKLNKVFDEKEHKYTVNGKDYISVSKLLSLLSSTITDIPATILQAAIDRGNNLHKITEDFDMCHIESEDEAIKIGKQFGVTRQIEHYINISEEYDPFWTGIEQWVANEDLRIAGTIDRIGEITINGKRHTCIMDIKSGKYGHYHIAQLVTYGILAKALLGDKYKIDKLVLFSIHKDDPKWVVLDPQSDEFGVFYDIVKSCLLQRLYSVKKGNIKDRQATVESMANALLKDLQGE